MISSFSCFVMSFAALNPGHQGKRLLMTYDTVLHVFVPIVGWLNPGACGRLGRCLSMISSVFMFCHVIGCAESWSLRASGQASVNGTP